jgi:beta-glucosidase
LPPAPATSATATIVLLRNDESLVPLKPGLKVYVERYRNDLKGGNPAEVFAPQSHSWDLEFVSRAADADVLVLWLIPNNGGLFGLERVNQLMRGKPTVVAINFSNPWVINEIDNDTLHSVFATFGTSMEAVIDVVEGRFAPTVKLPFTIPTSQQTVESNRSDVPGYLEPEGYALFEFDAGLTC